MTRLAIRDFGTALSFNGTSAKVASSTSITTSSTMSFTGWVKRLGKGSTGAVPRIFRVTSGGAQNFEAGIGSDGTAGIADGIVGFAAWQSTGIKLANAVFTHVAVIANGTTWSLYINGVFAFSSTNTAVSAGSGTFTIGSAGSSDFLNAIVDDVQVYNRALSANEVADVYYNGRVQSGAVLLWSFNEGAGTSATDSSGNGNTGTITAATYTSDVPMKPRMLARDFGTSLSFNGTTSKVVGSTLITQVDNVSFGGWARTRSLTAQRQAIFYTGDANNNGHGIFINKDTTVYGIYILIGSVAWKPTNILLKDTEWHHIFATRDTTNYYVYLDGVLVSVIPQSSAGTPTSGTRAGHDVVGYFLGDLDEIRHYSRQLSTSEVALLAQGGEPSTAGLNLLWKFDEGAGTSATDSSGSGNTGTITAGTYSSNVPTRAR